MILRECARIRSYHIENVLHGPPSVHGNTFMKPLMDHHWLPQSSVTPCRYTNSIPDHSVTLKLTRGAEIIHNDMEMDVKSKNEMLDNSQ